MHKLIIGIVNWNTKDLLDGCLASLKDQKATFQFSTVVVDNASVDGSPSIAKKYKVYLLQNKENSCMAAGLNQIVEEYPAEYYLFLHPDTTLRNGVLRKMVEYIEVHPDVGVIGPHLVYPEGKNFASFHRFPVMRALLFETFPLVFQKKLMLHGVYLRGCNYTKEREVDIIASACFLVRKKCLDTVGLLDPRFTNWMAEWDLCKRIKDKGWKIKYVPFAEVIHYEGQASVTKAGMGMEYKKYSYVIADRMLDSLFLFYRKHYSPTSLRILKILVIVGMMIKSMLYLPLIFYPTKAQEARERIRHYLRTSRKCLTQ